jgi:uncharacterized protein (TIGR02466 family)
VIKHSREAFSVLEVATSPPSFDDVIQIIKEDQKNISYKDTGFSKGKHGTTCFYNFNLYNEKRYRPLMIHIMQSIYDTYREFVPDVKFEPGNAWWTVYSKGAFIPRHTHYNSMISGAYYVRHPKDAGTISFFNPIANLVNHLTCESLIWKADTRMEVQPKTGTLLLFPSWLEHETPPNESDEDKIIVSFNLNIIN